MTGRFKSLLSLLLVSALFAHCLNKASIYIYIGRRVFKLIGYAVTGHWSLYNETKFLGSSMATRYPALFSLEGR